MQSTYCCRFFTSNIRSPTSKTRCSTLLFLLSFAISAQLCLGQQNSTSSGEQLSTQMPDLSANVSGTHDEKHKVLHTIRRVLENYSDDAIRRIFGSTMISPVLEESKELSPAEFATTSEPTSTTNDHKFHDELEAQLREEDDNSVTTTSKSKTGVMRIRAGLRSSSSASTSSQQQNDERPLNRHYRSARNDWLQHNRRKRKGCPPLHGRDQILCPMRNAHRYDVCISREQLCNHVVDCPGGEDEAVDQCFFYKPLDDQLKTLSHAVLLLVDNIMADSRERRQEL